MYAFHGPGPTQFLQGILQHEKPCNIVSAPWASAKRSDSMILLGWLKFTLKLILQNPPVPGHEASVSKCFSFVNPVWIYERFIIINCSWNEGVPYDSMFQSWQCYELTRSLGKERWNYDSGLSFTRQNNMLSSHWTLFETPIGTGLRFNRQPSNVGMWNQRTLCGPHQPVKPACGVQALWSTGLP